MAANTTAADTKPYTYTAPGDYKDPSDPAYRGGNPDYGYPGQIEGLTAQQFNAWLSNIQQRLANGEKVRDDEVPSPYHIEDGHLVVDTGGNPWLDIALLGAAMVGGPYLSEWLTGASPVVGGVADAATAGAAGTTAATLPAATVGMAGIAPSALPGFSAVPAATYAATTVAPAVTGGTLASTIPGAGAVTGLATIPSSLSNGGQEDPGLLGSQPTDRQLGAPSDDGYQPAYTGNEGPSGNPAGSRNPALTNLLGNKPVNSLIGLGVSGLFGYLQSKNTGNAINNATQAQTAAANKSIDALTTAMNNSIAVQEAEYKQAQANQAPWLAYGSGAVQTLGQLMGVKPQWPSEVQFPSLTNPGPTGIVPNIPGGGHKNPNPPGTSPIAVPRGSLPGATPPPPNQGGAPPPPGPGTSPPTTAVPRGSTNANTNGTQSYGQPQRGPQSQFADTSQPQEGSVKVRWPNGMVQDVPDYQLDQYEALGAQRVA